MSSIDCHQHQHSDAGHEREIINAFTYGDIAFLSQKAADKRYASLMADIAVHKLSSYELRMYCGNFPVSFFCDPVILISLMRRIGEPDQELDEQWDADLESDRVTHMSPPLRKDLLSIFKAAASSFTSTKSFADFMQIRINQFGYQIVGCRKSSIDSLRSAANFLISSSPQISKELIRSIQSFASLCPADTMYSLIETCLKNESAIPAVIRLIGNELRSCATGRAQDFDQNLLVTALIQHLYFNRKPDVPEKLSSLIHSLLRETSVDPVMHMEDVVSELIATYDYVDDMARLTRMLILLIKPDPDQSSSGDQWNQIDLISLLKFFMDSLLDLTSDAEEKDHLLQTIDLIMRRHIRRDITGEEIDEVANMFQIEVNRLPICYFQPYTTSDLLPIIIPDSPDSLDILLIVAMLDRDDLHTEFRNVQYPAKDLRGLLPYMNKNEWSRVYRFLIHFYEPNDMMCLILMICYDLFTEDASLKRLPILNALQQVFRQEFECGANQEKLHCVVEYESPDEEDISRDDYDDDDYVGLLRAERYRTRRKFESFKEPISTRMPYSAFLILHRLLRLEYELIPDPLHLTVRTMVAEYMKVMTQVDEFGECVSSPADSYSKNLKYWFRLMSEQRDFLIQLDPHLISFNDLKLLATIPIARNV